MEEWRALDGRWTATKASCQRAFDSNLTEILETSMTRVLTLDLPAYNTGCPGRRPRPRREGRRHPVPTIPRAREEVGSTELQPRSIRAREGGHRHRRGGSRGGREGGRGGLAAVAGWWPPRRRRGRAPDRVAAGGETYLSPELPPLVRYLIWYSGTSTY